MTLHIVGVRFRTGTIITVGVCTTVCSINRVFRLAFEKKRFGRHSSRRFDPHTHRCEENSSGSQMFNLLGTGLFPFRFGVTFQKKAHDWENYSRIYETGSTREGDFFLEKKTHS